MKQVQKRHSSLFLIELMISLLFFSLAAAVCIQFFIQAHLLSQQSANLNEAILISQSLAEEFRAKNGELENQEVYYDANWNPSTKEMAVFTSQLSISTLESNMMQAHIVIYEDWENPIYTLEVRICL